MTKSGFDIEEEALTDLIADAISDSMDYDWTARDGARSTYAALVPLLTEIRELRAENARLKKLTIPTWFYHPDYPEYCKFDPSEVIDEDYDPLPGYHVFKIDCAVALPSIWCAVHVSNDPDADERFTHTEHASEAEARAALGEPQ